MCRGLYVKCNSTMTSDPSAHIRVLGILQDMELAGFNIPKGAIIVTGQYSYHNNSEYWPDATKYSPERFLDKSVTDMPEWAPFGDGGRSCIGVKFAMEEAKVGRSILTDGTHTCRRRTSHSCHIEPDLK